MNHKPRVTLKATAPTNANSAASSDPRDAVLYCTPKDTATVNNHNASGSTGVTHRMIGDRCRTCRCPAPICDGIASREGQPCCGSCDHVSAPVERPVLRLIQDTAPLDNLAGPCGTCAATFSDCVLDPGLCCVGCDHETQPARPNLRLIQGGAA